MYKTHPLTPGDWAGYHLPVDRIPVPEPCPWPLSLSTLEEAPALIPMPCVLFPVWLPGASLSLKPTDCHGQGCRHIFLVWTCEKKYRDRNEQPDIKQQNNFFFSWKIVFFPPFSLSLPLTIILPISICMYEIFSWLTFKIMISI